MSFVPFVLTHVENIPAHVMCRYKNGRMNIGSVSISRVTPFVPFVISFYMYNVVSTVVQ